jgi:hypothetical protein
MSACGDYAARKADWQHRTCGSVQVSAPRFVDGQIELWHNPPNKGSEENE